jgi:hypothetical protein
MSGKRRQTRRSQTAAEKREAVRAEAAYTEGVWNGIPTYQCDLCQYDSMDERAVQLHILAEHPEQMRGAQAERMRLIQELQAIQHDAFGNRVGGAPEGGGDDPDGDGKSGEPPAE